MSTTLSEQRIVEALLAALSPLADTRLGYGASGLEELSLPVILVQLDSMNEVNRLGEKARFELQFTISAVVRTSEGATAELIALTREIRTVLQPAQRICPEARKQALSDTRFDIAPAYGQLSFADSTLIIEAIL